MDTTLVTVTLLSMGMAASLSVIVWRMLREERQRSEARVAALTTLAAQPPAAVRRVPDAATRPTQSPSRPRDLDLAIRESPVPGAAMFAEREAQSPWGHRAAVIAGLGLVIASVVLFSLAANTRPASGGAPPVAAAGGPRPVAATAVGLELMSLRDTRQPDALTITGLVQNPRAGVSLSRVTVTAYAFDEKGSFLASGRALLDVTALAPGDESPFVVAVPVTGPVSRYRIGFRDDAGRVIAHVDKRQQAPVAANW